MSQQLICKTLSELPSIADKLLLPIASTKIVAFKGQMGAGKTTLIKVLCKKLGVVDTISSPTFSIVNEYRTIRNEKIFHFDFYRIKALEEVFDLGYEDYFYSNSICLIEWPEMIEELLPSNVLTISITINGNERTISY